MLIGIDGNEANVKNRVGVNQYAFELLVALYKLQDDWKLKHKFIIYLKEKPLGGFPVETEFWKYKIIPGRGLWIITKLMPSLFLDKNKPDLFFTPSHYVPPFAPMPKVCSIMDLGYLVFSGQFRQYDFWQLRLWSAWSIFVSKRIISISKSTKDDIVRHYPKASGKVLVTQLAYDKARFNREIPSQRVSAVKKKFKIKKNYILFLSTLKPSKNIEGLLDAWHLIEAKYKDTVLVVAGKKGWLYESVFATVKKLKLEKRVRFTDFVDEADKPALIKGAKLFSLPSFWEGFGLDALASMGSGVPVVVSGRGSLPEVVGGAGIIVDPENIKDIAEGLEKVLSANRIDYNKYVKKGLAQAKKFSWEKTAKETLRIFESIK